MVRRACILVLALACSVGGVLAAGGGGGGGGGSAAPPQDPVIVAARDAFAKGDWTAAQDNLKKALVDSPNNADYHNLYAYSVRKGPNPDMELVFAEYNAALRINPKHRGAHEYIGEAYLQMDNVAKAKEHLARLDKLCFFPCEEYSTLKKAVADYESGHKAQASNW